jgi:hypothetical protein
MMSDDQTTWNRKYWDAVEQIYWSPKYIGFRSIPHRLWEVSEERVSVPLDRVNRTGPLYARERNHAEHRDWMLTQEEVLNHVFDITFAIAPDKLIEACFVEPLGCADAGPFNSLGREVRQRYGWSASENVTQHDGLFVSERSAISVELKLNAPSSLNQIIKYAALLAWEERVRGPKEHLGLLYVLLPSSADQHWRRCGLDGPHVDGQALDGVDIDELPSRVRQLCRDHRSEVSSVLDRMKVAAVTWQDLAARCSAQAKSLEMDRAGDQCLAKLIDGFVAQVEEHLAAVS